jgi:hypothetical protein
MSVFLATVTRVSNGYKVYIPRDDGDEEDKELVFGDIEEDSLFSFESVLWELIDYFGMMGSRYDKERLVVTRKPGDKHADYEEEEESVKEK